LFASLSNPLLLVTSRTAFTKLFAGYGHREVLPLHGRALDVHLAKQAVFKDTAQG
jgi:hypothetical protein